MRLGDWTGLVLLMLLPTMLVALALRIGAATRAVQRVASRRRVRRDPLPAHPPIERLAADLRRLLSRYEAIKGSPDLPGRSQRLRAVEGAIGDCACDAAEALGIGACVPGHQSLSTRQLRGLLQALAEEGLVLPTPSVL